MCVSDSMVPGQDASETPVAFDRWSDSEPNEVLLLNHSTTTSRSQRSHSHDRSI